MLCSAVPAHGRIAGEHGSTFCHVPVFILIGIPADDPVTKQGGRGAAEHTDRLLHAAITFLIQSVRIPPRERCLKAFLRLINYSAGDLYSLIHLNSSSVTFSSRDFPASVLPASIFSHSALFIFLSEKRTQFVGELPGFLTMAVILYLYINKAPSFQAVSDRQPPLCGHVLFHASVFDDAVLTCDDRRISRIDSQRLLFVH